MAEKNEEWPEGIKRWPKKIRPRPMRPGHVREFQCPADRMSDRLSKPSARASDRMSARPSERASKPSARPSERASKPSERACAWPSEHSSADPSVRPAEPHLIHSHVQSPAAGPICMRC
ncbi:unnamed protein product [Rhodiola kirilowii]